MRVPHFNLRLLFALLSTAVFALISNDILGQTTAPPLTTPNIKKFAIFGGISQYADLSDSIATGVTIASNVSIQGGGDIGSSSFVIFKNHVTLSGDIYSNILKMGINGKVSGNIYLKNRDYRDSALFTADALVNISSPGNIVSYGNVILNTNGTVSGNVSLPDNYSYVGPTPSSISYTPPAIQSLPNLPSNNEYLFDGTQNITGTQVITPGSYNDLTLNGGQKVTLSGVGTYMLHSILNTNTNEIVFDFKGFTTGVFRVIIQNRANYGNIKISTINGGDASRIYTEVLGSATPDNPEPVVTVNETGSTTSSWVGTVYASGGAIVFGNLNSGSTNVIQGSIWSAEKVFIGTNTSFNYVPLSSSARVSVNRYIIPYYPPPANGKVPTLIGSELTSLYEHPTDFIGDSIVYRIEGNNVLIEVISLQGKYDQTKTFLLANGLRDTVTNGPGSLIITGKFPIANLLILNGRTDLIDYVRPLYFPLTNSGLIASQGDSSMSSGAVRRLFDVSGQGVKIGVLSDSYNTIPGNFAGVDVANGDLPGAANPEGHLDEVQVVGEYPYGTRVDEGRAMLQIIHDVAPKAQLAFRTGFISAGDFAQGIRQLKTAGCKVIVDDITYITEPFLTDGIVANAVNEVVAGNTSYFTAAGNFGKKSFQDHFTGTMVPTGLLGVSGSVHAFTNSGNAFQTLNLQPGNYTIVLQWDDHIYSLGAPGSGTTTDLDIFLVDEGGTTLFGFNRNNLGGDPIEVLPFTVTQPTTGHLLIANANNAAGSVPFKYIVFRGAMPIDDMEGSSTIVGQANAAGANTVGAVLYSNTPPYTVNPPTIASFSSRGGTLPNSVSRNKPDFTAPNGVNTSVSFSSPNIEVPADPYPNFFGTSAAAPHAAAAAALVIEAKQKFLGQELSPANLTALLKSTAIAMASPDESGAGFIQPFAAIQTFAQPKPVIVSLDIPAGITQSTVTPFNITLHGEYLKTGTKLYKSGVEVGGAVLDLNAKTITATLNGAFGNPAIQLYNPPTIANGLDGGFSEPFYLFPKQKVVVTADDKTKKYGEALPQFTATIKINDVVVTDAATLSTLKLDHLAYTSSATSSSNVGNYFIKPGFASEVDATDVNLTNNYEFIFVKGNLQITKATLKITPNAVTVAYGQPIRNLGYTYDLEAGLNVQNRDSMLLALNLSYKNAIADSILALVNGGGGTTDTRVLVNQDFDNMSILVSGGGGTTDTRVLVNHGDGADQNTYVVDVASQSVINYVDNTYGPQPLVNGGGGTTDTRCLVNTDPLINGTAQVIGNGGGGTTDTRVLVNGDGATLNSSTQSVSSSYNTAVIIKGVDVNNPIHTAPINMVTRLTPGEGLIIPAAFLSSNFEISYGNGVLIITKASLLVAADQIYTNNGQPPVYTSTYKTFQYNDKATITHGPDYTISPTISGAGAYTITPSNLQFPNAAYYNITYQSNKLYINPFGNGAKKVIVKLECVEKLGTPVNGMSYVAHFSYDNKNKTPIFVPIGIDNKIVTSDGYFGNQPQLFLPGTNYFDILFTGNKMTYTLTTMESAHKTAVASDASSSSGRCKKLGNEKAQDLLFIEEASIQKEGIYPNPAEGKVTVISNLVSNKNRTMAVYDAAGRSNTVKVLRTVDGQKAELDVSGLKKGLYFIRLQMGYSYKTLSFIKM